MAMITSQQPSIAALPAKQRPEVTPTSGTEPAEPAQEMKGHAVEAATTGAVGIPGATAAALGEEHHGQPQPLGELEHAVLLAVVLEALGAGEHRVVVGHDDALGPASSNSSPLTRPIPATRPSAGVRSIRSSTARRCRCAAMASGPYSTKDPGSNRSATFSRAVRCPVLRRRATASGRASSTVVAWRRCTSARSARMWSRSIARDSYASSAGISRSSMWTAGCPSGTVSPSATARSRTTPPAGAAITCS